MVTVHATRPEAEAKEKASLMMISRAIFLSFHPTCFFCLGLGWGGGDDEGEGDAMFLLLSSDFFSLQLIESRVLG